MIQLLATATAIAVGIVAEVITPSARPWACAEMNGTGGFLPPIAPREDAVPLQQQRDRAFLGILLIDLTRTHAHDTEPAGWYSGDARGAVRDSCRACPGFVQGSQAGRSGTSSTDPSGCLIAAPQRRWTHPNGVSVLVIS